MVQVVSCTTIVAVRVLEVSKVVEGGDLSQGKLRDNNKNPIKKTNIVIVFEILKILVHILP